MSSLSYTESLDTFSLSQALRIHCNGCFERKSKFTCAGCQAVTYCSRECQKAAWKTHKPLCGPRPNPHVALQPSDLGYPSALALQNVLGEWLEVHRWSLYTLTCALVQLAGGPHAVLAPRDKALVLHVDARHRTQYDGNPAMTFRFVHAMITDKSSNEGVRKDWAEFERDANIIEKNSTRVFLSSGRTRGEPLNVPVGTLPVVYVVYRVGAVRVHAFTLFHVPLRHVESQNVGDERTRAALEDLVHMMEAALCHTLVFRRPENPRQPEPDWWICEPTGRRRRAWRWKMLPPDEGKWPQQEEVLNKMVPGRTSGLTARQVLSLLDYKHVTWECIGV